VVVHELVDDSDLHFGLKVGNARLSNLSFGEMFKEINLLAELNLNIMRCRMMILCYFDHFE
jgi:hypothetical protein